MLLTRSLPTRAPRWLLGWMLLLVSTPASAVTYQYTGNPFTIFAYGAYTSSDSVTGTFEIASALSPNLTLVNLVGLVTAYSFSDGVQTISNTTPGATINFFNAFSTDASGNIVSWNVDVRVGTPTSLISTSSVSGIDDGCFSAASFCDNGGRSATPGTWTLVPEPAVLALLAFGLAAVGAIPPWRRRAAARPGVPRRR